MNRYSLSLSAMNALTQNNGPWHLPLSRGALSVAVIFRTETLRADISRRAFLLSGAASAAVGLAPGLLQAQSAAPALPPLDAFTDILLPSDTDTPAASSLSVAQALLNEVIPGSLTERLLGAGTAFLDQVGPVPFVQLPTGAREEVVSWMATADYNAIPGRFYHVVRLFTVAYYFSHPDVVSAFPLNAAPQPLGYPPPWGQS